MKLMNILVAGLLLLGAAACSDDDKPTFPEEPIYDMTGLCQRCRCQLVDTDGSIRKEVLYSLRS